MYPSLIDKITTALDGYLTRTLSTNVHSHSLKESDAREQEQEMERHDTRERNQEAIQRSWQQIVHAIYNIKNALEEAYRREKATAPTHRFSMPARILNLAAMPGMEISPQVRIADVDKVAPRPGVEGVGVTSIQYKPFLRNLNIFHRYIVDNIYSVIRKYPYGELEGTPTELY
jgi:hypothetical protein